MVDKQQTLPYRVGKRGPMRGVDGREHKVMATRMRPEIFAKLDADAAAQGISKARLIGDLIEEAYAARDAK
jgi:hypothetical protein